MKRIHLLSTVLMALFLFSCGNSNSPKTAQNDTDSLPTIMEEPTNLASALTERKNNSAKKIDSITGRIYKDGLEAVKLSGVLESAKQVGDMAPDFSLQNAVGNTVNLKEYLKKGPVVLTWYRGGWCPYCNLTLHYLQQELPHFKAEGANLIAISPEMPDESISTTEKNDLEFQILSDQGNTVAKEYGVSYTLTEELANVYNKKFDLNQHNGDSSNQLPIAATYIINQEGKIVYAFLDFDYRNRAEPADLTAFLKTMNAN